MKEIIEEREQLKEKVGELQKQLEGKTSELDERAANADKLKNTLEECQVTSIHTHTDLSRSRPVCAIVVDRVPSNWGTFNTENTVRALYDFSD